ncbi:hypothetical protein J6590_028629 [Homalodisca vitripennis]|nr:hypothetical protein J6590_028629 [Homalodisca vitripennis]
MIQRCVRTVSRWHPKFARYANYSKLYTFQDLRADLYIHGVLPDKVPELGDSLRGFLGMTFDTPDICNPSPEMLVPRTERRAAAELEPTARLPPHLDYSWATRLSSFLTLLCLMPKQCKSYNESLCRQHFMDLFRRSSRQLQTPCTKGRLALNEM